ncbi:MAG: phosphotransferase family protein [Isosphaeraceae bacterium]
MPGTRNSILLDTERLLALRFWRGPITLEPLPGGITNHNYLVRSGSQSFVARLCEERTFLGIDRRNEVVSQREAHALGIAPAIVHHDGGVLVSEYLAARTLRSDDVRNSAFVPRLASTFRQLHQGWDRLTGEILYFSPFQAVRTYVQTARTQDGSLPEDIDHLLDDARRLAHRLQPFVPVLCHNDVLAGNILADEERVWLVDWEYAGIGHPLFDLANVSANCRFSATDDNLLLTAYRGTTSIDPEDLQELSILKAISLLREALWSVIQSVISDIEFDYEAYARDNFCAYRDARRKIDAASC